MSESDPANANLATNIVTPEMVDDEIVRRKAQMAAVFYNELVKQKVPAHIAEQLTVAFIASREN